MLGGTGVTMPPIYSFDFSCDTDNYAEQLLENEKHFQTGKP